MNIPRIIRDGFEVYPQKFGNDYTLEIDVEYDGIESHYQNCLSIDYEELKIFFDYITQQLHGEYKQCQKDIDRAELKQVCDKFVQK